jgi:hypothetical protein
MYVVDRDSSIVACFVVYMHTTPYKKANESILKTRWYDTMAAIIPI